MKKRLKQTKAARKARAYYRKNRDKILRKQRKNRKVKKRGGSISSSFEQIYQQSKSRPRPPQRQARQFTASEITKYKAKARQSIAQYHRNWSQ